jgi:hypothetical protein
MAKSSPHGSSPAISALPPIQCVAVVAPTTQDEIHQFLRNQVQAYLDYCATKVR